MKFKVSFVVGMLGLSGVAFADPKDLDPNARPLPPQAIGINAAKDAVPPPGQMPRSAQTVPQPSAVPSAAGAAGPCVRGQSSIRMGGFDIDELKCELAVVRMERAAAQERLERVIAAGSLVSSDLAATRESAKQHEAAMAEWFKGYFGEPPK